MSDGQIRRKQAAAEYAAAAVREGMTVGLGSGSTAELVIHALAERVRLGLRFVGVPTSLRSERLAQGLGIEVVPFDAVERIDLTIDGADEVERGTLNLIKGRGGALLREKLVALASDYELIVVDDAKLVDRLGARFPVPVEVVRFGCQATALRLEGLGGKVSVRRDASGRPFITDNGNAILDAHFGPIADPAALARRLKLVNGVVEHGLFIDIAREVVIGRADGVEVLKRPQV